MEGGALKKRKRFHGDSCRNTREIVSEIMEEQQQSMASFVETSNPDAFLCHACDAQGAKFSKLLMEAQKVKEGFAEKLSTLTKVSGNTSAAGDRKGLLNRMNRVPRGHVLCL